MKKIRSLFLLILLSIVYTGCSFKTFYNQLDYVIPEYISGMLTLDEVLSERLENKTLALLDWHRYTQLAEYSAWLKIVQQELDQGLGENRAKFHYETFEAFWKRIESKINQAMVDLLSSLDTAQRREFIESIKQKNKDFYNKFVDLSDQQWREQYHQRLHDGVDNWLGELTDQQQQLIQDAAAKLQFTAAHRLENRRAWLKEVNEIFALDLDKQQTSLRLAMLFEKFQQQGPTEFYRKANHNKNILIEFLAQLSATITVQQKDYFIDKSNDYIRQFTELASEKK